MHDLIKLFKEGLIVFLCSLDVLYINHGYDAIFEIRISAGDAVEIYENQHKQVHVLCITFYEKLNTLNRRFSCLS